MEDAQKVWLWDFCNVASEVCQLPPDPIDWGHDDFARNDAIADRIAGLLLNVEQVQRYEYTRSELLKIGFGGSVWDHNPLAVCDRVQCHTPFDRDCDEDRTVGPINIGEIDRRDVDWVMSISIMGIPEENVIRKDDRALALRYVTARIIGVLPIDIDSVVTIPEWVAKGRWDRHLTAYTSPEAIAEMYGTLRFIAPFRLMCD